MTRNEYPGAVFVGPPSIALETPDGWTPLINPDAAIAVIRVPVEGEPFTPNVVVQHLRFPGGYSLDQAIVAVDSALDSLDEVQDGGRDAGEQFGVPTYIREVGFRHPDVGTLIQHVRVLAVQNGPYVDVVQVTGTVAGNVVLEDLPLVRSIADSVDVTVSAAVS